MRYIMMNSHGTKENISISIKLKEISHKTNHKQYFLTCKAVGTLGSPWEPVRTVLEVERHVILGLG